ncbi:PEGA domain-containing protein [Methanoregula sp. UBA64]|jgi:hypothetical protein|uniref:PEGA domain-containing protein n=1 Tax=Methanoregula sp. UBA64 TaxID=1915554 RepID=UPI0025F0A5BE|nr:PEGA domain-containing protein [Methanoregula sp. UBA64]
MKGSHFLACLAWILLLVTLATPVAADPSITSISPSSGYNSGTLTNVVISGSNFNLTPSLGSVVLRKSGQSNITATIASPGSSTTTLTCNFPLYGAAAGTWDVVVTNQDGSFATSPTPFTVQSTMTLSSVTPATAQANTSSVGVTVAGTGLSSVSSLYLFNSDYTNLTASLGTITATSVTGTFDLSTVSPDTYQICVKDSTGAEKCGLSFVVTTDKVGTIDLSSTPAGASVYVDSTYKGVSPCIIPGLAVGSHTVKLTMDGYSTWSKSVKVTYGSNTTIVADLSQAVTATATTVPTSTPTTVKTSLKVTTVKIPTSWAKPTTTKASPVEGLVIIGAVGLAALVLRRTV